MNEKESKNFLNRSLNSYINNKRLLYQLTNLGITSVGELVSLKKEILNSILVTLNPKEKKLLRNRFKRLSKRLEKKEIPISSNEQKAELNFDDVFLKVSKPGTKGIVSDEINDSKKTEDVSFDDIFEKLKKPVTPLEKKEKPREENVEQEFSIGVDHKEFNYIKMGHSYELDNYGEKRGPDLLLPIGKDGLRTHGLISGTTGSGKTVTARHIIEQAAMNGIPSIVIDAQGDLSSFVFQCSAVDEGKLFKGIKQASWLVIKKILSQ